jgi:hypothetical protein
MNLGMNWTFAAKNRESIPFVLSALPIFLEDDCHGAGSFLPSVQSSFGH